MENQPRPIGPQLAALLILLVATLILYVSQGLTHLLVPLRVADPARAGLVTAAYFLGFALGAFQGGAIIRRVGHIRAFGGLLTAIIGTVLVLPLTETFGFWLIARFVHGACLAAAALVVESWLVSASDTSTRGRVLAVYTLAVNAGLGLGPLLLVPFPHTGWEAFTLGALLLAASAIPVLFWRVEAPVVPDRPRASLKRVFRVSPVSLAVTVMAGLSSGSFTALAPLFLHNLELDSGQVGLAISASMLSGLVLQWPLGHLSDRRDRRRILILVTGACALFALILALGVLPGLITVLILLALFQGTLYTLYPMALAHANDHFDPDTDTTEIASGLLLVYGVGAAAGPALSGVAAVGVGPAAGFAVPALGLAVAALYSAWKAGELPRLLPSRQRRYRIITQSTPEIFELEPNTVPEDNSPNE